MEQLSMLLARQFVENKSEEYYKERAREIQKQIELKVKKRASCPSQVLKHLGNPTTI